MIDYTKVVYVDSDLFLPNGAQRTDQLFDLYEGSPKPAARYNWKTQINAGFMLARPNITLYWDMLAKFNTLESPTGGDQGFQNAYFYKYQFGFEGFQDDHLVQVINSAPPYWIKGHTTLVNRDDPPSNIDVYHHFGTKIWMCPRHVYCELSDQDAQRYIWPQMVDLWWKEFDAMAREWDW
eukprot:CAMPEP_0172476018 /NCGR_PEP_ID=MMETSP1065-20121228/70167_1 /TAXON_ID=265537 /ORGANISM="Amphiprora paludosa, Strain CCMP125" /LENGTH=179 /DNA_ID=CAMNT_0013234233 /DNA_START=421 /DNA_END=957 /DNA_ORIENTATION=-